MTDPASQAHPGEMLAAVPTSMAKAGAPGIPPFEALYDTYFPYMWRSVQRLGVHPDDVNDVVQEIFLVVYRKLGEFEGRSTLKTWLYGIALRVARAHRNTARRHGQEGLDTEQVSAPAATRPDERAALAEAVHVVNMLLEGLEEEQREVFVLAELEQLSAPEIAEVLAVKLNTVYSRLRLARAAFTEAAARHRARDGWRTR
jgi:RNA polymerase sigma-70 factor (ECF subfamily)